MPVTVLAERKKAFAAAMSRRSLNSTSTSAPERSMARYTYLQFKFCLEMSTNATEAQSRVEAAVGRFKHVIGDGLRSRTNERRATEVNVAVHALNRMLEFGRPSYVRVA